MKKVNVCNVRTMAELVIAHAAWRKSRGRVPSMSFNGEHNPIKALALAKKYGVVQNHPERRDSELFLTNDDTLSHIGWGTKRSGITAYDIYGKPVTGLYPVFVQKSELDEAGILLRY